MIILSSVWSLQREVNRLSINSIPTVKQTVKEDPRALEDPDKEKK